MDLGAFSISLSVKNLQKSQAFYEKLGFEKFGGDREQNWLIMKNGTTVIGLFQDMFPDNLLTFNPGWDQNAASLDSYTDIREIKKELLSKGLEITDEIAEGRTGPANLMVTDPDGNTILIDQHI